MICGIPLVLDLGTRMSDRYVYVVFEPLLLQEADYISLGDHGLGGRREERSISATAVVVEPCYRRLVSKITTVTGTRCVRIVVFVVPPHLSRVNVVKHHTFESVP